MPWEFVTPDGITEKGKQLVEQKLNGKYTPEEIKDIINTIDNESRWVMLNRTWWKKLIDGFKSALPLIDSTAEKMSTEYTKLFTKEIPADINDMKAKIAELNQKKY